MSPAETAELLKEIKALRKDVLFIKQHMVDADAIMTKEEEAEFDRALQEYKEGKTTSLADLKRELKL